MASSDSSSSSKPAIQSKNASGGGQGEDGLVNLEESRTKFYVKKGGPYDGVYFTLDPTVVQYQVSRIRILILFFLVKTQVQLTFFSTNKQQLPLEERM